MSEFNSNAYFASLSPPSLDLEKKREDVKQRYSGFFLNEPEELPLPISEQNKNLLVKGMNATVSGNSSELLNGDNNPLVPEDSSGMKRAPIDKALAQFKEDTDSILNTPEYDKYTKADMLRLSFDNNITNAAPSAIRGFIDLLNDKSLASANTENKLLKDYIADNLEDYQNHIQDIGHLRMGSALEGLTPGPETAKEMFATSQADDDIGAEYAALAVLPLTFGHEMYQVAQELLPGVEFTAWDIAFPGDMRNQVKQRIKELPLEIQKEYLLRLSDIINKSNYAGMENDWIKQELAQGLLEEEDSTSLDIAIDNVFGALDILSIVPVVGAATKPGRQATKGFIRSLRKLITGDGRTAFERIEDLARSRVPENSPFAIASAIDPASAEDVLLNAIKDTSGRIAESIGVTRLGLTVEAALPKIAGSKVTPGISLDFSYYTSYYTDAEKTTAVKSSIDSIENIIDEVRSVTDTGTILPNNVFIGYDNGNISIDYHVTHNSHMGFSTYDHARAIADSYLNRLTRSDVDGVSVEIHARDVGANEYRLVDETSIKPGESTVGDYRVVIKSRGTPSGKHALAERFHEPGKIAGWITQYFDKSNWATPWGDIATAVADDRSSGFIKELRETLKPLNSLKLRDHREIFSLIDEGDTRGHWFTTEELVDKFQLHPRKNDLIQAYHGFQRHQALQKALIDFGAKKLMDSNNVREFFFSTTRVLPRNTGLDSDIANKSARYDKDGNLISTGLPRPEWSGSTILASPVDNVMPSTQRIYDAEIDKLRNITDADRARIKDGSLKVYKMITDQFHGKLAYRYIVAAPDSRKFKSRELPSRVTRDSPGYLSRVYDAAYLAMLKLPIFTDDGGSGFRTVVLGIEQNIRDAQVLLEEVKQAWKAKKLAEIAEEFRNSDLVVAKRVAKYKEKKQKAALAEQEKLNKRLAREKAAHTKKINAEKAAAVRQIYREWYEEAVTSANRKIADPIDVLKGLPSTFRTHQSTSEAAKEALPEFMKGELPEIYKQKLNNMFNEIQARFNSTAPTLQPAKIDVDSAVTKRQERLQATVDKKKAEALKDIEETLASGFKVGLADEIDPSTGKRIFDPNSFEWLETSGQLYTSPRRTEELRGRGGRRIVKSISDTMEQARRTAARMATVELVIDKLVRNYDQLYGAHFGKFPWLGDVQAPRNMDADLEPLFKSAQSHANYVKMLSGLDKDSLADLQRRLMIWSSRSILSPRFDSWQTKLSDDWSNRIEGFRRETANALMRNRDFNAFSKVKATAFFQLITARPFRQALLQANQMSMYLGKEDYRDYFFLEGGMREYVSLWSGLVTKSTGQYGNFKDTLAKSAKMSMKEYDELVEAYQRTGLPASIDSHIWTFDSDLQRNLARLADEQEKASAFRDGVHTFRNKVNFGHKWLRRMGFDLGEQSQLLMAFLAEKHTWQLKHGDTAGILWKQDENLSEIAGRARILSGNMNQAGKLAFQGSIPGLLFQFLSHTSKMAMMMVPSHIGKYRVPFADKIVSHALTNAERGRILYTQALLYGTGGTGLTQGWELLRDEVLTEELDVEVDRKINMIVEEGLFGSLINAIANFVDNGDRLIDLEISKSLSPLGGSIGLNVNNPITKVLDLMFVTNGTMKDWGGAGFQVLRRMVKDEFLDTFWGILGDTSYLDTPERIGASLASLANAMVLETDTWVRSRYEHTIDNYVSQYGNLGTNASDIEILSKTLLGIRSRDSREYQDLKLDIKGLQNDPKIGPPESFVKATEYANSDFKALKDALTILDKEVSRADLNVMVRKQAELRKHTFLPGEYVKYRTQFNKKLAEWQSDLKRDPRSGLLKGGSEFEFINLLSGKINAMAEDPLEDMISKLRNMEDYPQKEQLISRMERIIK